MIESKPMPKEVMKQFWKDYEELTKDKFDAIEDWRLESKIKSKNIILDG